MALPNVISAIFVKVLVPIPRGVSLVHSTVSSQRTSASRHACHVRHTQTTPVMQFQLGILFRGCSNSLIFKLPYSLGPPIAPTAMDVRLPYTNCGIATYPNRAIGMAGLSPDRLRPCRPLHQTPVVTCTLAITHPGLLPSSASTLSAFTRNLSIMSLSCCPQLYIFRGSITQPTSLLRPA
jgi:hypothetical protein